RALPRFGDRNHHFLQGRSRSPVRNHTLELKKSAAAVDAVPVQNSVERIEERAVVHQLPVCPLPLAMEVGGVEQSQRGPINERKRRIHRERQYWQITDARAVDFTGFRVIASDEMPSGSFGAPMQTVDP